jgi:hypothetical protein
MFLASIPEECGLHDLDFRFEIPGDGDQFLFAHHGLNLHDLAETIDLSSLGSIFYMVEACQPFALQDVIADKSLFLERYGVKPAVLYDRCLAFDRKRLIDFFLSTRDDDRLDCIILGTQDEPLSEEKFERLHQSVADRETWISLCRAWNISWLRTHDNHFFWLTAQSFSLLRRLIAESILGFFSHVHACRYAPVPDALIDLIIAEYHTAPLVCLPTAWVNGNEVPADVQSDDESIQALLETAESSWIAYQLNPPRHLVGRGLLVSYHFGRGAWSFEPWA